ASGDYCADSRSAASLALECVGPVRAASLSLGRSSTAAGGQGLPDENGRMVGVATGAFRIADGTRRDVPRQLEPKTMEAGSLRVDGAGDTPVRRGAGRLGTHVPPGTRITHLRDQC